MADFKLHTTTASAAHDKVIQDRIEAAHGRILNVIKVVGAHPTAHVHEKIEHLEKLAELNEAYLRGPVNVPTVAPAVLGAGTTPPPVTTPTTSNVADQQRIAELEGALKDVATMLGINTIPSNGGKVDEVRLKPMAQTAINNMTATPPAPAGTVDKTKVAEAAKNIREASKKLKSPVLKGSHISGLNELNLKLDELDKLAK